MWWKVGVEHNGRSLNAKYGIRLQTQDEFVQSSGTLEVATVVMRISDYNVAVARAKTESDSVGFVEVHVLRLRIRGQCPVVYLGAIADSVQPTVETLEIEGRWLGLEPSLFKRSVLADDSA